MALNTSVIALSFRSSTAKSPFLIVGPSIAHPFITISKSNFDRFAAPLVSSSSQMNLYVLDARISHILDTSVIFASYSNTNITSSISSTSDSTLYFSNCGFYSLSSSNYGGAIYVAYSSCNFTVISCIFQCCTCTAGSYSGGAIGVHPCGSVTFSSTSFKNCSSSSDVTSYQIASQSYTIQTTSITRISELGCGTYTYSSAYASVPGASTNLTVSKNNVTLTKVSGTQPCGLIINTCPHGSHISNVLIYRCTGGGLFGVQCGTNTAVVSHSIFANNTISSGLVETFSSTIGVIFTECAFIGLPSVSVTYVYPSGFVIVYFDHCCFDSSISQTYESIHGFLSSMTGVCIYQHSNSFTIASIPPLQLSQIFPIFVTVLLS